MTAVASITLSPDQQAVFDKIEDWYIHERKQVLTVGGYAGTGKSTLIAKIADKVGARIGFCAYTGKAGMVVRRKLSAAGAMDPNDYCGTIHSLIYKPVFDAKGRPIDWELKPAGPCREEGEMDAQVFIIDEASMIDQELLSDLKSYGLPILAVGDHGQLPPVEGKLNLMADPDLRLEKIHRQAEGNPIISLSMMARQGKRIHAGHYSEDVVKQSDEPDYSGFGGIGELMVICHTNKKRQELNAKIRAQLGRSGDPVYGEKVICLRNNREAGIWNGTIGFVNEIEAVDHDHYYAKITMEDGTQYSGRILKHQFGSPTTIREWGNLQPNELGDLFDFGYALTCHKAQGSEARRVVVYDEMGPWIEEDFRRRWLYTAITRSSERLTIVGR